MGEPALQLAPVEEAVAESAAQQTTRLVVIEGGKSAAGAAETTAGEAVGEGVLTGLSAAAAAVGAFLLVLLWPSEIAPEPKVAANSRPPARQPTRAPAPVPAPAPNPVTSCPNPPVPCEERIQKIRDAIERNKRLFNNRGMHGLRHRRLELIFGPCGPGQMPYRVNRRGQYVKTPVWQNHINEFNNTKTALYNRFIAALDADCEVSDDLMDEASKAQKMEPPTEKEWLGDPDRPCLDSEPPPDWQGRLEPPSLRGL